MQTIFLVVPNYVYSSDFFRTRFFAKLAEVFRVVALMTMDPTGYPVHPNVTYVRWRLQYPDFWTFWGKTIRVPLIRMFDHEPLIQRNYQISFGHWKRKLLRRIAFLFPKYFWNPGFITRLETKFLPRSAEFEALVNQYRPALLLAPTPGFGEVDAEAIILARRLGIPTVAMDFSWDNLTSNCKHLRKTDWLVAWTARLREQAIRIHGYSPERVFVSGIMRFDQYASPIQGAHDRDSFLKSKELDPTLKTLLITTVTRGNYKDEPSIIRRLLRLRDQGAFGTRGMNLFIRLHPKEDNYADFKDFETMRNVRVERGGHERPTVSGQHIEMDEADLANLKDTLRYADVVVNYASTITLEACLFDKPVVNIGFPPYYLNAYSFTHYKPVVDLGAVRIAKSFDDLVAEVTSYIADPRRDRDARAAAVREFIGFTDGTSYVRAVEAIERIAAGTHGV